MSDGFSANDVARLVAHIGRQPDPSKHAIIILPADVEPWSVALAVAESIGTDEGGPGTISSSFGAEEITVGDVHVYHYKIGGDHE